MHQTDAQHAAGFFHAEAFGKIQGVEIAIPRREPQRLAEY